MKIINLTPHDINIEGQEPVKSSGVARCSETIETIGNVNGIDVIFKSFGEVVDLPEPKEDTIIIVSLPVAQAVDGVRNDCFIPGEIIRDENGKIIGCKNIATINRNLKL